MVFVVTVRGVIVAPCAARDPFLVFIVRRVPCMLSTCIFCPCRVLYDRGGVPAQRLPAVRVAASLAFCQGSFITDRVALVTGCAVPCAFLRGAQCTLAAVSLAVGAFFGCVRLFYVYFLDGATAGTWARIYGARLLFVGCFCW